MKIQIYDQTYSFGADQDEEYLKKLAAYVDEKKCAFVGESTHAPWTRLKSPCSAALNIADEMFTLRERQRGN